MPTASLRRDHDLIRKVAAAMRVAAGMLREGRPVPAPVIAQVVDFTANFADACHHRKEEGALFPALEAAGMPRRAGPIAVMLAEHERSREIAARMAARAAEHAGGGDAGPLAAAMEEYAEHVTAHMWKEDNRLFPMADALLAGGAARVAADVEGEEAAALAGRGRARFEGIAGSLPGAAP